MKTLNSHQITKVSGGMTCKEALIEDALYWSIDDPTQYCTKEQMTTFMVALIDLVYTIGPDNMTEQKEVDLIRGLSI